MLLERCSVVREIVCLLRSKLTRHNMGLFGDSRKKDPRETVRNWTSKLRKEGRTLDRQIHSIQREEQKITKSMKDAAKKGDQDTLRVLGRAMYDSKKAVKRIYIAKAQIKSVENQMHQASATLRVAGSLSQSTEVMKSMQQLIKIPEIQATMRDMSKEMMKMGIIEEMMEDSMDMVLDGDEEVDDEVQNEIDKILLDLTQGELGRAPAAVSDSLPVPETEGATAAVSDDEEVEDMQARLEALRS